MGRIFLFIYQYRAFFTFLLLELFCAWLIVENNRYQGAQFFNSSNTLVGNLNTFSQNVRDYFFLRDVNETLAQENATLRKIIDKNSSINQPFSVGEDSVLTNRFDFISARVVNNSTDRYTNFITIDRGKEHGIEPGMAVISSFGAVGKVRMTSEHFSVVTSLLNINFRVSGILDRTGHFGTIQWDGKDPQVVEFNFIPRHVEPVVGDSIKTSGYSGVFPAGILIGTVDKVEIREEAPFYELRIKLAEDFQRLSFITVIKSNLLHELDSLEQHVPDIMR